MSALVLITDADTDDHLDLIDSGVLKQLIAAKWENFARVYTLLSSLHPQQQAHAYTRHALSCEDMRSCYWMFTRFDRRTDRSVRLVCPTGRSDDRIV